ncbi:MAG: hypothetical protein OXD34_14020 [bacterium]|nr:hypothetical protein [bacterium]
MSAFMPGVINVGAEVESGRLEQLEMAATEARRNIRRLVGHRNELIREAARLGYSGASLARACRLSTSQIYRILNGRGRR